MHSRSSFGTVSNGLCEWLTWLLDIFHNLIGIQFAVISLASHRHDSAVYKLGLIGGSLVCPVLRRTCRHAHDLSLVGEEIFSRVLIKSPEYVRCRDFESPLRYCTFVVLNIQVKPAVRILPLQLG